MFLEGAVRVFTHAVLVGCVWGSGLQNKVFVADSLAEGFGDCIFIVGADCATWLYINSFPVNGYVALFDGKSMGLAYLIE